MGLNNNIEKQILVPKRPHDAYDMNAKVNALWGNIATKGKEIRETENPQEHNVFRKEKGVILVDPVCGRSSP